MSYTVQQLALLAGVSVRTLHHYDHIDLLKPSVILQNGYRQYGDSELLILQQILFFRELDFSLKEIRNILASPGFDISKALIDQRKMIELRKKRLQDLMNTIDKTLLKLNQQATMNDEELYGNFSKNEMKRYSDEAKERWGHTDAYRQSEQRVKNMGKEGLKKALEASKIITLKIADALKEGISSDDAVAQKLILEHYNWLYTFYDPTPQIYKGLAEMYISDDRFKAQYEKISPGLAQYMHDAMLYFVEHHVF